MALFPESLYEKGFNIELENNTEKLRVGMYIKTGINFARRRDLEGLNSNLIVYSNNFYLSTMIIYLGRC